MVDPYAGGMVNGVQDRGRRRYQGGLAHAFGAERYWMSAMEGIADVTLSSVAVARSGGYRPRLCENYFHFSKVGELPSKLDLIEMPIPIRGA